MPKNSPISSETIKLWAFENFGQSWFILNSSNLLSEILEFPTLKTDKNQTDYQNHLKSFLSDRGVQSIKSQETLGHNYSPTLNKIAKTKKGGNLPPQGI